MKYMSYFEVSAVPCSTYNKKEVKIALSSLLDSIGGLDFVTDGMCVAIKANLVTFAKPEEAVTTHPALICALIELLKERGASRVIVGDSPGGLYNAAFLNKVYSVCGLKAVEEAGGELNHNFEQKETHFENAKVAHTFTYTAYLDEADAIIDFCKLKTHGMMGMSAAAKNMFGVIPGTMKPEYHFRFPDPADFARMIVDIDEYFSEKIKLCIADAIVGMEGNGPTQGTPRQIGALLASKCPHKLDMVCAKIIGLDPDTIPTLGAARERGLIPTSIDDLNIFGDVDSLVIPDYNNVAVRHSLLFDNKSKIFGKVARAALEAKPTVKANECKGCEKCKQICPAQAIIMKDGKPVIDRKKCIKCFCCQEFCPFGAMKVHRPLLAKILT
ncbi:MAG: DUF362 domain-containing protein [Ruminococcaceae bacterium]|nr:DUF362 domain-containing protein [Oscillospiraceae bacterium]